MLLFAGEPSPRPFLRTGRNFPTPISLRREELPHETASEGTRRAARPRGRLQPQQKAYPSRAWRRAGRGMRAETVGQEPTSGPQQCDRLGERAAGSKVSGPGAVRGPGRNPGPWRSVRSHRSRAGEGGSRPPGQAQPPPPLRSCPAPAGRRGRARETDGGSPLRAHRIGGMIRQANRRASASRGCPAVNRSAGRRARDEAGARPRRRGGMADAADLGSVAHRAWGFKSPRRH